MQKLGQGGAGSTLKDWNIMLFRDGETPSFFSFIFCIPDVIITEHCSEILSNLVQFFYAGCLIVNAREIKQVNTGGFNTSMYFAQEETFLSVVFLGEMRLIYHGVLNEIQGMKRLKIKRYPPASGVSLSRSWSYRCHQEVADTHLADRRQHRERDQACLRSGNLYHTAEVLVCLCKAGGEGLSIYLFTCSLFVFPTRKRLSKTQRSEACIFRTMRVCVVAHARIFAISTRLR